MIDDPHTADIRAAVRLREASPYQVAPVSTKLILAYLAEHVLDLPRSY